MDSETWAISDTLSQLQDDPWRQSNPFSRDITECHAVAFDPERSRQERAGAIAKWLAEYQPCLFGRMEAKQNRLAFCMLTENDLEKSDQEIRHRIQRERDDWRRAASEGSSHGFLIVAVSEQIAAARPNAQLHRLATYLCNLYLGVSDSNQIHLDELLLQLGTSEKPDWRRWKVGVNYFSAQADGRWWHDHRIPGGLAFSMNSVGHMARTQVERKLRERPDIARAIDDVARDKLVYWALRKAMETIAPPVGGSGRATWLADRGTFPEDADRPPFEERKSVFGELARYSENRYKGLYHTDQTIPSSYFDEGLWRREDLVERDDLYFTYLHSLADKDYEIMGIGKELELGELRPGSLRSEQ